MRLPRKSTYHGTPFEFTWMPYGYVLAVGVVASLISPVWGVSRPTIPDCSVNHNVPFWSKIGV